MIVAAMSGFVQWCAAGLARILQSQTKLTRSALVRILKGSERLPDFFLNPQRFMDAVAATIEAELHRLIVNGIRYERISPGDPDFEWQMELFKQEETINYIPAIQVQRSVYEYVVYDSEEEREFAMRHLTSETTSSSS
jgi:type III restriction enzyme